MANTTLRQRPEEPIPEPEPVHVRRRHSSQAETESDDEYEATELRDVSPPRQDSAEAPRRTSRILSPPQLKEPHWYDPVKRFWRHNVRVTVAHVDCRDHLANERTFLGYLRTSLALSFVGVIVAQLYRLQHVASPDPVFGYYVLSKPIAGIFQVSALCVALIGAHRYWRQQTAMAIGQVVAGGWELMAVGVLVFVVSLPCL